MENDLQRLHLRVAELEEIIKKHVSLKTVACIDPSAIVNKCANGMSAFCFAPISTQVPEAVLHTVDPDSPSEK